MVKERLTELRQATGLAWEAKDQYDHLYASGDKFDFELWAMDPVFVLEKKCKCCDARSRGRIVEPRCIIFEVCESERRPVVVDLTEYEDINFFLQEERYEGDSPRYSYQFEVEGTDRHLFLLRRAYRRGQPVTLRFIGCTPSDPATQLPMEANCRVSEAMPSSDITNIYHYGLRLESVGEVRPVPVIEYSAAETGDRAR